MIPALIVSANPRRHGKHVFVPEEAVRANGWFDMHEGGPAWENTILWFFDVMDGGRRRKIAVPQFVKYERLSTAKPFCAVVQDIAQLVGAGPLTDEQIEAEPVYVPRSTGTWYTYDLR